MEIATVLIFLEFYTSNEPYSAVARTATGQSLQAPKNSPLLLADIGPTPAPEVNGFDSTFAGAVSRRTGHLDFFVLGRRPGANNVDKFIGDVSAPPLAPYPLTCARKGQSDLCRFVFTVDQLDVFYVCTDHQLTTQW